MGYSNGENGEGDRWWRWRILFVVAVNLFVCVIHSHSPLALFIIPMGVFLIFEYI